MSVNDTIDWFSITAYFAGECPEGEREAFEHWLNATPERRQLVHRLRVIWQARKDQPQRDYGREDAIAHVMAMIRATGDMPHTGAHVGSKRIWGGRERGFYEQPLRHFIWYRAAGVVMAAFLIVAGWVTVSHRFERRLPSVMATYATANGQRATISLTDGSTVTLNVASRLEVPSDYASGNRTLRLVGEALFTVSHHSGAPFTVLAGPTATRVLGTSFVVRRYGQDTVTMVAVSTGKVAVGPAIVTQNHLVEIGRNGVARIHSADASQFGFATGVLTLQRMSLSQAIPDLDRWYDADIRLGSSSLVAEPIEGYFTAGSLADLAERLAVIFDVRVVRDGRILTLYPR